MSRHNLNHRFEVLCYNWILPLKKKCTNLNELFIHFVAVYKKTIFIRIKFFSSFRYVLNPAIKVLKETQFFVFFYYKIAFYDFINWFDHILQKLIFFFL